MRRGNPRLETSDSNDSSKKNGDFRKILPLSRRKGLTLS